MKPFDGDMDDYKALILGDRAEGPAQERAGRGPPRRPCVRLSRSRSVSAAIEDKMAKFQDLIGRIDKALADRDAFLREPAKAAQLGKQRADLAKALAVAEEDWLVLSAQQDAAQ